MADYRIENDPNHGRLVTLNGVVVGGPYYTEAKAKRRIRDLKAKELTECVHGNLVVPVDNFKVTTEMQRQLGCYPAVSKNSYRR